MVGSRFNVNIDKQCKDFFSFLMIASFLQFFGLIGSLLILICVQLYHVISLNQYRLNLVLYRMMCDSIDSRLYIKQCMKNINNHGFSIKNRELNAFLDRLTLKDIEKGAFD